MRASTSMAPWMADVFSMALTVRACHVVALGLSASPYSVSMHSALTGTKYEGESREGRGVFTWADGKCHVEPL